MRIMGPPSATPFEVGRWLADKDATLTFVRWISSRLWDEATAEGVDPVGVICQSAKETGFGRFGGAAKPWMHNTCGLRIDQEGLSWIEGVISNQDWTGMAGREALHQMSHATFANWIVGARAHVQHLLAYTGGTPRTTIVDPRFRLVRPPLVSQWSELGGRWAPSKTYGTEIEKLITEAQGE